MFESKEKVWGGKLQEYRQKKKTSKEGNDTILHSSLTSHPYLSDSENPNHRVLRVLKWCQAKTKAVKPHTVVPKNLLLYEGEGEEFRTAIQKLKLQIMPIVAIPINAWISNLKELVLASS